MKRTLFLLGFVFFIGLGTLAHAEVDYHGDTIRTSYGAGDFITGTLNITLNRTNFDSTIRTNFANTTMLLRDFIAANGFEVVEDYNCSTANCLAGYVRKEPITSLAFSGDALVGFSVQGTITTINDASISFESSSSASCYLDLGLDVLNKSEYFLTSTRYIDESCYEPRYGCFERALATSETLIMEAGREYCERITLPIAPAFRAGVNATSSTTGQAGLKMQIHTLDAALVGECTLPQISGPSQVVECTIPFSSPVQRDYFVCVTPTGSDSNHKIRYETHDPCGTPDYGASYPGDYEIFAKNLKFDTPRIDLSENGFANATGADLSEYMSNYLSDTYGNACTPYCVIPLRLFGSPQNLNLQNRFISYTSSLGGQHISDQVYRLDRGNVTIDAHRISVDLGRANFTIPPGASGNRLRIFIDDEEVVDKRINLSASFTFGLTPLFATFGETTQFSIVTPLNITSVRWKFGDGSAQQTSSSKTISYRYLRQGTFNVEVEATRSDGVVGRRTFGVTAGNARDAATSLLASSQQRMNAISANLTGYPPWTRDKIKEQLDYDTLNSSLREATLLYGRAANDSDYAAVVNAIIALDMPLGIRSDIKGTVPLLVGLENVDIASLREVTGGQGGTDEDVSAALGAWTLENTDATIAFESVSAYYESSARPVMTIFKVQTRPTGSFEEGTYFVVGLNSNDLLLANNYAHEPIGTSATAFSLGTANEIFEFAVLDSIRPEDLGSYITPPFATLGQFEEGTYECNYNAECDTGETWKNCPNDCRPWGLAAVIIIVLIGVGAIALGAILWWYKTRYETTLFAHKQDLTNVLTFITNSTHAGMNEREIHKKLKHAGWTNEQIGYAFAKHKKIKPSVNTNDVRFIKRPDFKAP